MDGFEGLSGFHETAYRRRWPIWLRRMAAITLTQQRSKPVVILQKVFFHSQGT
jgi:hypothetical protein